MADTTCSKDSAWYSCADGFRGCCSVDPCGLETCPVDSNESMTKTRFSSTKSASAATSSSTKRSTSPESPSMTRVATTTRIASTATKTPIAEAATTTEIVSSTRRDSTTDAATSSPTTSTTCTPTSALSELDAQSISASGVTSSNRHLSSAKIGGIVGGVVSLVLILCLIAHFMHSRKKRRRRVRRRFTLLRWRHPRLEDIQMNVEEGAATGTPSTVHLHAQAKGQPSSVSVHGIVTGTGTGFPTTQTQLQTILEEQSLGISPLRKRETDSLRSTPSASTSSPSSITISQSAISPKTNQNLKSAFTPKPPPPGAVHPALRSGQGENNYRSTAYLPSFCTPKTSRRSSANTATHTHAQAYARSRPRHPSMTPELFDTGFYLGRLELPTTCSRELINIPFAERQRQRQKSQLHRGTTLPLSITTPDGAILWPNFNGLPVDVDADGHAMIL
ncbi:hypothetical protein BDW66DRAFT_130638 [Aspergillus desertorum]